MAARILEDETMVARLEGIVMDYHQLQHGCGRDRPLIVSYPVRAL